jgi:ribosomal protein S18 acetylase RimI-like enzyme
MTESVRYRPMKPGDEVQVSNLVARSFNEFIAPGFSEEGIEEFFKYANHRAIVKRSEAGDHFVIVAETDGVIVGMIEIKERRHVSMLFVDKSFQRKGVATELLSLALEEIGSGAAIPEKITVNSSPFAVSFYERAGFKPTSEPRTIHGIVHIPMALELTDV